jgi:DNA-directed RNA polymerase subunit RPC12/RpoP
VSRKTENAGFICIICGAEVKPLTNGSYRNHCPCCLYSVHIDTIPGDRANDCLGSMKPIGVRYHSKKGWQIVHRCQKCGIEKLNRIAPDDMDALLIMMKSGE